MLSLSRSFPIPCGEPGRPCGFRSSPCSETKKICRKSRALSARSNAMLRRLLPMPHKLSKSASHADESMVEKIHFHGWNNAWRLSNGTVELIVLADVGPRIVHYGFCGHENVFYEAASDRGLTGGDEFRLYGGHRLWVWPEVAQTYFPDNLAVTVSQEENCVRFRAPIEDCASGTRLEKEFAVALDADGTQVRIAH